MRMIFVTKYACKTILKQERYADLVEYIFMDIDVELLADF